MFSLIRLTEGVIIYCEVILESIPAVGKIKTVDVNIKLFVTKAGFNYYSSCFMTDYLLFRLA